MKTSKLFTELKVLIAACVGGGLELYDFVIYIFFAPTIAHLFFPKDDYFAGMLGAMGVFAIGYFARPLGGLIFGHLGDKHGRKKWLLVSILLMGFSTLAIGCLPTYAQIGVLAPLLLVLLRLLQGVAIGGDLPGAVTFVAEHAAVKTRGFNCGFVYFGVNMGLVAGSAVAGLITGLSSATQLMSWGWRIGFWSSAILIILGFYLRRGLPESAVFLHAHTKKLEKGPLKSLFTKNNLAPLLLGGAFVWLHAVIIVQLFLQMPVFIHEHSTIGMDSALYLNTVNIIVFSVFIPVMGLISDHIGRRNMLLLGSALFVLASYPLYLLLVSGSFIALVSSMFLFDVIAAMIVGTVPVTLTELFGTRQRYSGVAVTYNVSQAIFAGLTPIVLTLISAKSAQPAMLSLNLIVAGLICLLGALCAKKYIRQEL